MTDFSARVAAVSSKRKLAALEIVHAKMKQGQRPLLSIAQFDLRVQAKIHVAVQGCIIMNDRYPVCRWEQPGKFPRS
jgi:hypothetical protein